MIILIFYYVFNIRNSSIMNNTSFRLYGIVAMINQSRTLEQLEDIEKQFNLRSDWNPTEKKEFRVAIDSRLSAFAEFAKKEKQVLFLDAVRGGLPAVQDEDTSFNDGIIFDLYNKDFTVREAQAYCMCMEEFNPELAEDIALERMANIHNAVMARKKI